MSMIKHLKYFFQTIFSKAYWQYILFSKNGIESILSIFGFFYLLIESLDFFQIYTRDKYASFAFFIFFALSLLISILFRRPIKSISIKIPKSDLIVEVKIEDLFEINAATMISTNTAFEADVSGGKISPKSLQGQFTAKFFPGNQNELIKLIRAGLKNKGRIPFPMGTTVTINTHGKTFYFTAMADLNDQGNAFTSQENIIKALDGLWNHIRDCGELQDIVLPAIGTGRGRLLITRKKIISLISESFVRASEKKKFTDRLIISIRPEDAGNFEVNLYDIKDHLQQVLLS
jgi:hypothetical protein